MNPQQTKSDVLEIGEHRLVAVDGRIQYDKIWRCENCGHERTCSTYFGDFECDPNASVETVRENSRKPTND